MRSIEEIMTTSPVIPVIVIHDIEDAVPLAQALVQGGAQGAGNNLAHPLRAAGN